ncbi:MAG: DUF4159 domain-containing protein, partial [Phycisphaerae bacterium]|nr:DUF4159 domain-containing protein [Phycisphaerae bacterium]
MNVTAKRYSRSLVVVILFFGTLCHVAQGAAKPYEFSHATVMKAIDRGVAGLWKTRNRKGVWPAHGKPIAPGGKGHYYPTGPTAAAAYALLESGVSPMDPKMKKVLGWLKKNNDKMTYSMGFRLNVWKIANQKTKGKYSKYLKEDAILLLKTCNKGHYSYHCKGTKTGGYDNSCSQYGLLGIWAAKQAGLEIPKKYWEEVLRHWIKQQGKDGGWAYKACKYPYGTKRMGTDGKPVDGKPWSIISSPTMATAGLASLFVCVDNLYAKEFIKCRGNTDFPPIKKGLAWFDKNFPKTMRTHGGHYYYLYGVERVGLASGYKYFGKADWYKAGVRAILARQKGNGCWGAAHNTAYALLFLIRGKYPVVFNKLEYHGHWNNRPRDLASLTRWMSHAFEQTFNWQIINLRVPVSEMHDASFLYIAGDKAPEFTDKELTKLRTFVYQGGTLFCVGECGGTRFNKKMREVYRKLFPKRELAKCGKDHPIYSSHFKTRGKPELYVLSNGIRPLVIHSDKDLSR